MTKLVGASVSRTLVRMAVPMLAGTFAMNAYYLTNSWFVSRLGTEALAAVSFTYPVVMLLVFVTRGLASGAMTLVAHSIGSGDHRRAARLTWHAILLALCCGLVLTVAGELTIEPVFTRLGASGEALALTCRYMRIWYAGAAIMVVQMVTADILIGTGNTVVISAIMAANEFVNIFFDMGLIFGNFGLPRMGIAGAAIATLIAQAIALAAALYILGRRMHLLDFKNLRPAAVLASWRSILSFGVPGALGMIVTPLSSAVITRLVARYGNAAVAAIGVAGRIEIFAFMIPMTVGMSLIPFVAQNYGAGRLDRILLARRGAMLFAFAYGIFIAAVFFAIIDPLARLFSSEQAVLDVLRSYIYITCAGYGLLEVHRYAGFCMTGVQNPVQSTLLNIMRALCLLIPLSLAGETLFGLHGIFYGRLATDILAGLAGIYWSGRILALKAAHTQSPVRCNAGLDKI